jgi:hypothetical protein
MSKLLWFRQYLKCRKQALDNFDDSYMLAGDYVPDDWDEDIKLVGDGPPLLNERVLARYYLEIAKLDEVDIPFGDYRYWDGFQRWGYNPLDGVNRKDLPLPVEFDCGPIIQPDESSTIEEEPKMSENLITTEINEEVAINEEKINLHSSNLVDCQDIDFVVKPDEEVEIFIVEFELDGIGESYYMEMGNVEFWRSNEEWNKAKRRKMGKASKAFFRCP